VTAADVTDDGHPTVIFSLTDDHDRPLDVEGLYTEGAIGLAYTVASADASGDLTSIVTRTVQPNDTLQATSESNGTLTRLDPGEYLYTFSATLPDGAGRALIHRVGVGARRTFDDGSRIGGSGSFDFVPATGEAAQGREWVSTDACNACHQSLEGHGGRWTDIGSCTTCHTSQTADADTGNSVEFKVMVHRIHTGASLPSVVGGEPYRIIGFGGSVHDYSQAAFPQAVTNCTTCHQGRDAAQWKHAEERACTSCHDRTWFERGAAPAGYTAHSGGPMDGNCHLCHQPDQGLSPVSVVHRAALADPALNLAGLTFTIDSVEAPAAGQAPVVRFHVNTNAGPLGDLSLLSSFTANVAGPVPDYAWNYRVSDLAARATADGDGWTVTLSTPLPADAAGTIAVGFDGYRRVPYGVAAGQEVGREVGGNPVAYAVVGGGEPAAREARVDRDLCNACHGDLALHGGGRKEIEYCVTCHHQNATDAARRPADQGPPETVEMADMVHRIHAGGNLQNPAILYGFGNTRHDYSAVVYPGALANCEGCHVGEAHLQPSAAACITCHDSDDARAHADLNTTVDGREACGVCHGPGRESAVDVAHGL
jgi:OmcA/MtrC family decaheme c-type cytochrome